MSENGITDLTKLLRDMSPRLRNSEYVFVSLKGDYEDYSGLDPISSFRETEGLSLIVQKQTADNAGMEYSAVFKCITLTVHSSLSAVGLTAAVSGALAQKGISANIVAAFHHDHLFVPAEKAAEAMDILAKMGGNDVRIV